MISEPRLRLKLKRLGGRITVPILFDEGVVLRDSFDIARHADLRGTATPLFPPSRQSDIAALNSQFERAMEAGRCMVVRRTADHPSAKYDSVPGPTWARPALGPLANLGLRYFVRKYDLEGRTAADDLGIMRDALLETRELLGGRPTIYGELSYADIIAATFLQFVQPCDPRYIRLSEGNADCWTTPELAAEFADLVAWRDALYDEHR
jgi:glutathione S-transferase